MTFMDKNFYRSLLEYIQKFKFWLFDPKTPEK